MFEQLGQITGLLKQLPKIQEEMGKLQERLAQITAEGDAGGGMVKVRFNGQRKMLSCVLSDEALKTGDKEMLEDLIAAAVNQALERINQQTSDEAGRLATNLGLPPGLNIPGLTGS